MASVERRKNNKGITFRAKVRVKGFPSQSATFSNIADAKQWGKRTEADIIEGIYFKSRKAHKRLLSEAIDRYKKHVLPTKPRSAYAQGIQLDWWRKKMGRYSLAEVTPSVIVDYRDKLAEEITVRRETRSAATINRYMAALGHVFTIAFKEWEWVNENPFSKIRRRKEPRGRVRFLSDEERVRLLAECKKSKNPYLYVVVVLALSTGARSMEIKGLRWSNVDFNRSVIVLDETKNQNRRVLPLVGHALELMRQYKSQTAHINCELVFPGRNFKQPMDLRTPFNNALKKAGIKDFRFHDLRHSCASYLAMNGASITEISEVLGHKTLQMVKRYTHLSESHTAKVISSMNEKIFGCSEVSANC